MTLYLDYSIEEFLDNYTPNMRDLFKEAFELLYIFSYEDKDDEFLNLVMRTDVEDKSGLMDQFTVNVIDALKHVLNSHSIKVSEDTPIRMLVDMVSTLSFVQNLEDYTSILDIIENPDMTSEEKICRIVSLYHPYPVMELMDYVMSVKDKLISSLQNYIHDKQVEDEEGATIDEKIVKELKVLRQWKGDLLAFKMLDMGVQPNHEFSSYMKLIDNYDYQSQDIERISYDLFSVILMSKEGINAILAIYRKHAEELFDNVDVINAVETRLMRILGEYLKFKRTRGQHG